MTAKTCGHGVVGETDYECAACKEQRIAHLEAERDGLREAIVISRRKSGKQGWFCLICRMWWPVNTAPVHAYADGKLDDCPLLAKMEEPEEK